MKKLRHARLAQLIPGVLLSLVGCGPGPRPSVPSASTTGRSAAPVRYENVAVERGITYRWRQRHRPMRILDAIGGGCAFLDYDNDGWLDILLVGPERIALYHNQGNGRFQDVSEAAGIQALKGAWMGCAVGDVDGDGFLDVLLTGYHRLALLKNKGGKRYVDVTRVSGLDPGNYGHWGLSAGFMDLDGSGRLALVLTNYVRYGASDQQYCEIKPGIRSGCPPDHYRSEFSEVWEYTPAGRYRNITSASGAKPMHGNGMVVAFADVEDDGRMDFYIGNDGKPAELMRNLGGLRFRNAGSESGVAVNHMGHAIAAMGADWGDYDRDGRLDLAVTAFSDEPYSLLHNEGKGAFSYASDATVISAATFNTLGFGAKFVDMDNDGWPDICFANGHVYDNAEQLYPETTYRQPLMLFHNEPGPNGRQFADQVPEIGGEIARPITGRGLASGDFDNDGRVDLLVVDYEGAPLLLHNTSQATNHWITFDLKGSGRNRFAYGAHITARTDRGGLPGVWVGQVSPASSFLSSSDPRIHFGLGTAATLDSVEIRWPDGSKETLRNMAADRVVTVRQRQAGEGSVKKRR